MTHDLGTKHVCFNCGAKFYDLKKPAPICPKCAADQRQAPPASARKRAVKPEVAEESDDDSTDEDE